MADFSVNYLQQLQSPVAFSPPCAINTEYDSILIMNGNKFSSVLQFDSRGQYIKTESISLAYNRIISLSSASNSCWVIACDNSGRILAIEWKSIMGTKTPSVEDYTAVDIFASLLNEHIDNPKQPKLLKLSSDESSSLQSVQLCLFKNVKSAYLVKGILIAFIIGEQERCCTLNIWKPLSIITPGSLPSFSHEPNIVISHCLSDSDSSLSQRTEVECRIPFLVVRPSLRQSCSFEDGEEESQVVTLTSELFSYLFGSEETLSQSLVIVYGCHCGLVFACSIKKLSLHNLSSQSNQQQKQIYCLDQSILSIHALSFSNDDSVKNCILIIGRLGKIALIVSSLSSVSTQEVIINGPLLSSLVIPQQMILLSTLTSLKLVCLKCYINNEELLSKDTLLITLFEHPLTILYSPYYLLSSHKGQDYYSIVALRIEGQLCSIKLPVDLNTLLKSEGNINDELTKTLNSIQSSSDVIKQLNSEISTIDNDLIVLNELCSLVGDQLDDSSSSPLIIELNVLYEQLDVLTKQPFLNIKLSLQGEERPPLRKGCFLSIMMSPSNSHQSLSKHNSSSLSLEGLSLNKSLNLKLPIPSMFLTHYRFKVTCCLSLSISSRTAAGHEKSMAIPLITQSLNLLDFIQPLTTSDSDDNMGDQTPVIITISDSLMFEYFQDTSHHDNELSSLSSVLVKLLGTTTSNKMNISKHLMPVTDCHGNHGYELLCILPDNSLAKFSLMKQILKECEVKYILSVVTCTQIHTEELMDIISKKFKK